MQAAEIAITRGRSSRGSRIIQARHDPTTRMASAIGTSGGSVSSQSSATMATGTATTKAATPSQGVLVDVVGTGSIGSLSWFVT